MLGDALAGCCAWESWEASPDSNARRRLPTPPLGAGASSTGTLADAATAVGAGRGRDCCCAAGFFATGFAVAVAAAGFGFGAAVVAAAAGEDAEAFGVMGCRRGGTFSLGDSARGGGSAAFSRASASCSLRAWASISSSCWMCASRSLWHGTLLRLLEYADHDSSLSTLMCVSSTKNSSPSSRFAVGVVAA